LDKDHHDSVGVNEKETVGEKAVRSKTIYLAESGSWNRKWRSRLDTFT
jgi:hypothetical protein